MKSFFEEHAKTTNVQTKPVNFKREKTPKHNVTIPSNAFGRILFHNKATDYCICRIDDCRQVVSSSKGSNTALFHHIEHHDKDNTVISNTQKRPRTEVDVKHQMDLLIALHLIGRNKMSAFKVTSEPMVAFYRKVLELGGFVTEDKICSSRKKLMNTVHDYAKVLRENLKFDVNGAKVCVVHDDGTTNEGLRETLRAISITFIKHNRYHRRFLSVEKVHSKTSESIAASISKSMEFYGISNYFIASDGASANNAAAHRLGLENQICMTHTVHRLSQRAFDTAEVKVIGFKALMTTLRKILNKASRKHINPKLCDVEGFVKIPTLVDTRWLSLFNCVNSLLKNHEIIISHRSLFGFTDSEFSIFCQKALLSDLRDLLQLSKTALLKLETQKSPTIHLVIPVFHCFFVECIKFTCNIEKTNIGRQLAYHLKNQIQIYIFGDKNIAPRLTIHQIIQTGLDPDSNLFNKYYKNYDFTFDGLSENGVLPKDDLKNEIISNMQSFRTQLFPSLKEIYRKMNLQQSHDTLNSDSSESDIDLDSFTDMSDSTRNSLTDKLSQKRLKRNDSKMFKDLKYEYEKYKAFAAALNSNTDNDSRFTSIIEKYKLIQADRHFSFWGLADVKMCFPILQKIIMDSIVIPASNAMVESLFSHLSDIKTFRRSNLSEKSINDLLALFYADLYLDNSATNYFQSELSS